MCEETSNIITAEPEINRGYLEVPLENIKPKYFSKMSIYLKKDNNYSLYCDADYYFSDSDRRRLLENHVNIVYVSAKDSKRYYRNMENDMSDILKSKKLNAQFKSNILYSTNLALAEELMEKPPESDQVRRAQDMASNTLDFVLNESKALQHLTNISYHDGYSSSHIVNACSVASALAKEIGMTDHEIMEAISRGAILHDVGKSFISSDILDSKLELSFEDMDTIRSHVKHGYNHLSTMGFIAPNVMHYIMQHHERLDGSGYPEKLRGGDITMFGRIGGIVDSFEAMTSIRPFREKVLSIEDAMQELRNQSPEKYDRDIVNIFCNMIERTLFDTVNDDSDAHDGVLIKTVDNVELTDRRRHPRHYFRVSAELCPIIKAGDKLRLGPAEKVIVHNISRSGVGLLSSRPLDIDQNICLKFLREKPAIPDLTGVIVRKLLHSDGWHTLGIKLHKILSEEMVSTIVS
ncbi:MAG: HD domain-containing protein [Sedimentisphaerales bacterium]|nr:HD domain-containing protein [Sedimentisphaerales bacterium]